MAASVWRGRLAFGMVSIPVRLYKAARRERIRFHHVYQPAAAPEQFIPAAEEEDEPATPAPRGRPQESPRSAPTPAAEPSPVARVRNLQVAEDSETAVEKPQVLKGFEIEKDRYVTFEPHEVASLRPQTSKELEIAEFVRLEE